MPCLFNSNEHLLFVIFVGIVGLHYTLHKLGVKTRNCDFSVNDNCYSIGSYFKIKHPHSQQVVDNLAFVQDFELKDSVAKMQ